MCDYDKVYSGFNPLGFYAGTFTVTEAINVNLDSIREGISPRVFILENPGEQLWYRWNEQERTFDPQGVD